MRRFNNLLVSFFIVYLIMASPAWYIIAVLITTMPFHIHYNK